MPIKTTKYHFTPIKMAKIRKLIPNVCRDIETQELCLGIAG